MHCILLNIKMIMEGARIHIYGVIPGIYPPAPAAPPPAKKNLNGLITCPLYLNRKKHVNWGGVLGVSMYMYM